MGQERRLSYDLTQAFDFVGATVVTETDTATGLTHWRFVVLENVKLQVQGLRLRQPADRVMPCL
jgi:hypothetical protein